MDNYLLIPGKFEFPIINSIVNKEPSHCIANLQPYEKNVELKVIVVKKLETFLTKENRGCKFWVADTSGSIQANFFDDIGESICEGDILYINNAYVSNFKNSSVLYQGKQGLILKIGEFFFPFNITSNF